MYLITTTTNKKKEAERLRTLLLKNKIIACGNITKTNSSYWWKNKIQTEKEFTLTLKTTNKTKCVQLLKKQHSYDLPEILIQKIETTKEYEEWVKNSCKTP